MKEKQDTEYLAVPVEKFPGGENVFVVKLNDEQRAEIENAPPERVQKVGHLLRALWRAAEETGRPLEEVQKEFAQLSDAELLRRIEEEAKKWED